MKIPLDILNRSITDAPKYFITTASFEGRCLSIPEHIERSQIRRAFLLRNDKQREHTDINFFALVALFGNCAEEVAVSISDPISSADHMQSTIVSAIFKDPGRIFVDVTTFTHEQLLILIKLLKISGLLQLTEFGYNGAEEYSANEKDSDKWLSRGIASIRSVLGYSGRMVPSKRTHLVILMGFEYQRVQAVIEAYEPSFISLGIGRRKDSMTEALHGLNQEFSARVERFISETVSSSEAISLFEFSCVDPIKTCDEVTQQSAVFDDANVVICPMNTKLSTLGAGLAAFRSPNIQLCYAEPVEYNADSYSTPSDTATVIALR